MTLTQKQKNIIRRAYLKAISEVFSLKQKDFKHDVHLGEKAPGQWSDGRSLLEVYCEGDIPNATDYHNMREFGFSGYYCHSEQWGKVDDRANTLIREKDSMISKVFHEPYNNAVVCVYFV